MGDILQAWFLEGTLCQEVGGCAARAAASGETARHRRACPESGLGGIRIAVDMAPLAPVAPTGRAEARLAADTGIENLFFRTTQYRGRKNNIFLSSRELSGRALCLAIDDRNAVPARAGARRRLGSGF
jgi:hypothetical protein